MRVRLRTRMAGPSGTAQPGDVVVVHDSMGRALIAGGFAEAVADGSESGASHQEEGDRRSPVQEAVVEAPERAVSKRGRRKPARGRGEG